MTVNTEENRIGNLSNKELKDLFTIGYFVNAALLGGQSA